MQIESTMHMPFLRTVAALTLILLSAAGLTAAANAADMTVARLQCESRENPLGVDRQRPSLSWIVESKARGARQTAYRILAASSKELLSQDNGDLWDSGKVVSDTTTEIPYAGKSPVFAQQLFWKVQAWDAKDQPTAWSEPATWTMGPLDASDWSQAEWISAKSSAAPKRVARGYHAAETADPNEIKWVQVDLGLEMPIEAVRLHPMRHEGSDGFGFPVRYKVEASDNADFSKPALISDQTRSDVPNPGYKIVTLKVNPPLQSRYVRITAVKAYMRNATAACFAMSQLEVISNGKNVALGKPLTAKDSFDNLGWKLSSLTDGLGLIGADVEKPAATLLLRNEFTIKPGLRRALVFVCGLGYCEMTVNGQKATDDVLSPGWSKYNKTCLYESYDITSLLRNGPNAVGLFLGNGMYNVKKLGDRYVKFEGSFGPQKAIAQIRLEYDDGTTETVATNQDWKVAAGPVTFSSVYGGEDYDARLYQPGWDQPGFNAGSAWSPATEVKGPGGELKGLSCAAPPIRQFELFKPVKITAVKPGVTVYDFGQNAAQMMRINCQGPPGSSVRIRPSELVNADGSADQQSTGTPIYCVYTLAGTGKESWSPRFFYSGYRYLQVELLPAPGSTQLPILDSIQSNAVNSSSRPIGKFNCSNDLFNRIYTLIRWAERSNMVSILTDCPHRERLGWLEQIHLNGPALRYNFDLNAFFTKTMNDMADSQLDSGLIPTVAPDYVLWGSGDFYDSPEWGSAFLLVAWQQYQFTGSTALLERYYDRMVRYVDFLGRRSKSDIVSYGLSDWYDIGPGEPGFSKLTPKGITATAFYFQDTLILAQSAKLLGRSDEAAKYAAMAEQIRRAFNAKFFNTATHQYGTGSQAADSIALVMGLAEQNSRAEILEHVVKDVQEKGLTAGDIGYRYLLSALATGGRSDVVYAMNNQSTGPGYGLQLARGATSLTEAWDAHRSSSQNHFMLGQINEWFFQNLAGIGFDPASPGFKNIVIKPTVVGDLTSVKASYDSVHGPISTEWTRTGNTWKLHLTIPANSTATVYIPTTGQTTVMESGKPAATAPGVTFSKLEDHDAVYQIGSGSYDFTSISLTSYMKYTTKLRWLFAFCLTACISQLHAEIQPLDCVPDQVGMRLQEKMIWASPDARLSSAFVAFRKRFSLKASPSQAKLHLFADVRYMLWINGRYVLRGPARFDPKGPEYDTDDVTQYLHEGDNELVVLVMANQGNGKMMHHAPGLTVSLEVSGGGDEKTIISTDSSWKWSDKTRYRNPRVDWGNEMDVIDSTLESGDWTQRDFNDESWTNAAGIDGHQWGALSARRIPLLKDTPLKANFGSQAFPITVTAGHSVGFKMGRLIQAYTMIDFDADTDTRFELSYAGISCKAKAGRQTYISTDTHGFSGGSIKVTAGKITIYSFQPVELIYPFECVGSFKCSDPLLNKLWALCARSLEVMSEDSYVDCSDRERTEWMDDTPPCFDITQTAMAGPGDGDAKIYGDPRLMQELLRRTALSLQPDGWVKAHTCSDRFDIHAKMEDRACDWVEGARLYYETTGNAAPVCEIWPAIVSQMNYFLARRSSRGLVIGREWVMWDNPMGYENGEGTGLNAFVCKALSDAAFLGKAIGKTDDATRFDQAAKDLSAAINNVLWDEQDGTYFSGYDTPRNEMPPGVLKGKSGLQPDWHLRAKPPTLAGNEIAPTVFPALFALDQEVVPPSRCAQVAKYLLSQPDPDTRIMFYYYYWKQLYAANRPELDQSVLDAMRRNWKDMANEPWQTSWEDFHLGSKAHCYGMFPGYFLSAYVLGVRPDGPASEKRLRIDPRLGDLASAEGTVVTPFGLVPVSWKRSADHLAFEFTVPDGATATLCVPVHSGTATVVLDHREIDLTEKIQKSGLVVHQGIHVGSVVFSAGK